MARTAEEYRDLLLALLPPGQAIPRDPGTTMDDLLLAMADEMARLDNRGLDLLREMNPLYTAELLPEWEAIAGLPDKCSGELEPTLQGRRNALVAKIASTGGQSRAYFIAIAAALGYTVTIDEYRPFRVGEAAVGDALTNDEWVYAWRVLAPETTIVEFRTGESAVGEPLRDWGNDLLECKMRELRPAHTWVHFSYGA